MGKDANTPEKGFSSVQYLFWRSDPASRPLTACLKSWRATWAPAGFQPRESVGPCALLPSRHSPGQAPAQDKWSATRLWAARAAEATADLKRGQAIAHAGLKRPLTWPLMRRLGPSLHLVQPAEDLRC